MSPYGLIPVASVAFHTNSSLQQKTTAIDCEKTHTTPKRWYFNPFQELSQSPCQRWFLVLYANREVRRNRSIRLKSARFGPTVHQSSFPVSCEWTITGFNPNVPEPNT